MADNVREEKREFPRLAASVVVDYLVLGKESIKSGRSKNIGAGGICLIVYEDIEPETVLDLKINLPGDVSSIRAKGRVIWRREFIIPDSRTRFDLGVEFLDMDGAEQQKILQYVFSLAPDKK